MAIINFCHNVSFNIYGRSSGHIIYTSYDIKIIKGSVMSPRTSVQTKTRQMNRKSKDMTTAPAFQVKQLILLFIRQWIIYVE